MNIYMNIYMNAHIYEKTSRPCSTQLCCYTYCIHFVFLRDIFTRTNTVRLQTNPLISLKIFLVLLFGDTAEDCDPD